MNNHHFNQMDIIDTSPKDIQNIVNPVNIIQNTDAFGRLRISMPNPQYEYVFEYNAAPLQWDTQIAGLATSQHITNTSIVKLRTLGSTANLRKSCGYGDSKNGIFIVQDQSGLYFMIRSYVTGIIAETKIYQADWNRDTGLGTGKSTFTLDVTKAQILSIDCQFMGRVRIGFIINGNFILCHELFNTNLRIGPYVSSLSLPIIYEMTDNGGNSVLRQTYTYFRYRTGCSLSVIVSFNFYAVSSDIFDQIAACVFTETGIEHEDGYDLNISTGLTERTISTRLCILAIQPKLTFNTLPNHGITMIKDIDMLITDAGIIYWELIYDPTFAGSPTWTDAGSNSLLNYSVNATTTTGGVVISSGFISGTATNKVPFAHAVSFKYPLTINSTGLLQKSIALMMTALSGNVKCVSSINYTNLY